MDNLFFKYVKEGNLDKVKELYTREIINIADSYGLTPIAYADGEVFDFLYNCPRCDLYFLDSSGKSLLDIALEKGINISKYKLLRSDRTPMKINNIPLLHRDFLDKQHHDILINDDLENFKVEEYNDDTFLLACQYQAWKIVDYLITIQFNLKYISKYRFTAISFTFYYGKDDISERLYSNTTLTRNIFNELPIQYGNTCIEIKDKILRKSNNINSNFKYSEFKRDDFDFVFNKNTDVGLTSTIIHAIHLKTLKRLVLKQIPLKDNIIDVNILQEINIHKFINDNDESLTVKFYGYFVYDKNVYLVLEPLICTLQLYLNILKQNVTLFKSKIKDILLEILNLLNKFASLGIIHGDLKLNNIMIDYNGKFRLIDFGMSRFLGLSLSNNLINEETQCKYIYPPDRKGNLTINDKIVLSTNRKSLNYDIYSMAVNLFYFLIIDSYTDKPHCFISNYENIYATNNRIDTFNYDNCWYVIKPEHLIDDDVELYKFFKTMLYSDSEFRNYPKDCLKHKFFTGTKTSYPFNLNKNLSLEGRSVLVSYVTNNSFEAYYKNEMFENFKNIVLTNKGFIYNEEYMKTVDYILNIFKKTKGISFDIIMNFIVKFKLFINNVIDDNIYKGYAIMIYVLTCIQFREVKNKNPIDIAISISDGDYDDYQMKHILLTLRKQPYIFNFIPFQTLITYIIIKFKEMNYPTFNIEIRIYTLLIKFQIYSNINYNIWNIISNIIHYILPGNTFDFIDNKDDDIITKINDIVINDNWFNEHDLQTLLI